MIFQLIIIAIVLLVAYWWAGQGALSGFLHLACVIAAGAIAFATWELITLKGLFPMHEMFNTSGWALGLILPFVISLAIFRVVCDKLIGANLTLAPNVDFAVGGVFGGVAGIITAGIIVIGIGHLQIPPKLFGFQAYISDPSQGNITANSSLWIPVDSLTEGFYKHLSSGAFATSQSLARFQPQLAAEASLIRMSYDEGQSRNSMRAGDATVSRLIKVSAGNPQGLYTYGDSDSRSWAYEDPWNERITNGTGYIAIVEFAASAREESGSMALGNAQFRLAAEDVSGNVTTVFPMAVVGQANAPGNPMGRFRFDSQDLFVGSIPGESRPSVGFEFIVPSGYTPIYLIARGLRLDLPEDAPGEIEVAQRNELIASGALFSASGRRYVQADDFNTGSMQQINIGGRDGPIRVGNQLPSRWSMLKDQMSSLKVNNDKLINGGRQRFTLELLEEHKPRNMAVNRFFQSPGERIVQVDVSASGNNPMALPSADSSAMQVPLLIDDAGNQYTAAGYVYQEGDEVEISFDVGNPILNISQLPSISRSRTDQTLFLLFVVRGGITLERMSFGADVRASFRADVRG